MKTIHFTKMAGAGNDFVIIDAQKGLNYKKLTEKMCDRTNGIGADGLIILDQSKKADYRMRIINADGSEAEMCGNGVRCLAAYIVRNRKPPQQPFSIATLAGVILGEAKDAIAVVRLSDPVDFRPNIPLTINKQKMTASYIDTGVPHTIINVDHLDKTDVQNMGKIIRYHKAFKPRGTNVNFVQQLGRGLVDCRTYERGVEGETKACGTGSVAAAIVTYLKINPGITQKNKAKMKVKIKNGEILHVTFDIDHSEIRNVWLKGSAKFIAKGEYYV